MELLIFLGALAVVFLLAVAGFLFLQQRRAGTIRAVVPPQRGKGASRARDGQARAEQ